jgi:ABC-2 type transport system permease protein
MRWLNAIRDNPVLVRELRRRMRGKVLVFSIIIYVSVLCGVAYLIIFGMTKSAAFGTSLMTQQVIVELSLIGRTLFWATMGIQGFLVIIIAPILTASVVPMEREKKTFEFIQVTTITPRSFVLGCLVSTTLYALLIMIISLPVVSLTFLYGGISPGDVLRTFGFMLLASLTLSSIGLFVSSTRERARGAIGAIVGLLFLLYFLASFAMQLMMQWSHRWGAAIGPSQWIRFPTTFYGIRTPVWVTVLGSCALLTAGSLLVAARKLYEVGNRALSFLQMLFVFPIMLFILLGFVHKNFNNDNLAVYLFSTAVIIVAGIMNCSIGDRRIGDQQWRLKKKFTSLRTVDEGFWFPMVLIVIWLLSFVLWLVIARSSSPLLINYLPHVLGAFLATFLFLIALARLISLYIPNRRAAVRVLIAIIIVVFGLVPTVTGTWLQLGSKFPELPLLMVKRFSPVMVAADYMNAVLTPGGSPKPDMFQLPAGFVATLFYLVSAIAIAAANVALRKKKIKLPPYYYEL